MSTLTDAHETEELLAALSQRRDVFDSALDEMLAVTAPEELHRASRHPFEAGGKRLRPVTTLLVAEALAESDADTIDYRAVPDSDGNDVDILQAAYALEVIHTFTLVHDDIMDDDDLRRGAPAVHRAFNETTAILSGDYLYAKAQQLLLTTGAHSDRLVTAATRLAETMMALCEGQARDITFESRDDVTPEEYIEMVRGKTAVLYGSSAALPAILLGEDEDVVESLYQFGVDVGTAFQIYDDVLDLTGDTETLGKNWGSDLVEQKKTLITLHALDHGATPDDIFPETPDEAALTRAVETLQEYGSIEYARQRAQHLVQRGQTRLSVLPETPARDLLVALAEYLVQRSA